MNDSIPLTDLAKSLPRRPGESRDIPAWPIPPARVVLERPAMMVSGEIKRIVLGAKTQDAARAFSKMCEQVLEAHLRAAAAAITVQVRTIHKGQGDAGQRMVELHLTGLSQSIDAMNAVLRKMEAPTVVVATPEEVAAVEAPKESA